MEEVRGEHDEYRTGTSTANRTETIQAGNDQNLLSTQVDQFIQPMAAFTRLRTAGRAGHQLAVIPDRDGWREEVDEF